MLKTFITDTGLPVPAVTADEMRRVDRLATEETGPDLFQMMENAGRNLAEAALARLGPEWKRAKVAVLAGAGGNGGGGICAARHLANRGMEVWLCLAAPDRLREMAAWQRHVFRATPGREVDREMIRGWRADLVLDALLGYGLKGPPAGCFAELIRWANSAGAPILSLDVPSGIEATTGEAPGEWVRAAETVTLALPKTGLTPERSGRLLLADVGIPPETFRRAGIDYRAPFDERYLVPLQVLD